jgi:hypothetical protein
VLEVELALAYEQESSGACSTESVQSKELLTPVDPCFWYWEKTRVPAMEAA